MKPQPNRLRHFIRRRPKPRLVRGESCIKHVQTGKYLNREKPAEEPVLDGAVWSRSLPDDVFCTILARLPMSSLVRFRVVCKAWNAIVDDPNFLEACSRVSARQPCLVLKNEEGCSIYEPATDNWMPIPASFFHPRTGTQYSVMASSGGRVLLLHRYRLMLFNPLNNSKKALPPMMDMDQSDLPTVSEIHVIGMYVASAADFFNILIMDKRTNVVIQDEEDNEMDDEYEGLEPFAAQVYESRSNSWEMKGSFDPEYEISILNACLFDDTLRCLTKATQAHVHYSQLAIYSVLKDLWDEEAIDMPDEDQALVSPHLFTNRGKQLLVAALPLHELPRGEGDFPVWNNIIIWELKMIHPPVYQWVRMLEINPKEIQKELWNIQAKHFIFLSEGDFVYFGSKFGSTLAMIDLKSQTWRVLPPFPEYTPYDGRSVDELKTANFLFEPRFDLVL